MSRSRPPRCPNGRGCTVCTAAVADSLLLRNRREELERAEAEELAGIRLRSVRHDPSLKDVGRWVER